MPDGVRKRTQPALSEWCDDRFEQMDAEALEVLDTDIRQTSDAVGFLTISPRAAGTPDPPHRERGFPWEFSLKQSNGDMVRFNSTAPCNSLRRTRRHPSW
ncbi:MAG TPA: hypothetical protein VN888_13405 [Mycobacterium sp.]|nr:hypothetical protein [Mycobacterium sp.]